MIDETEVLYDWPGPPRITLLRGRATLPSGLVYTAHWLVTDDGKAGAVVCALRGESLLFVCSPRPALGRTLLELPRGFPAGDSPGPLADALRELREETGFGAHQAVQVGQYVTDSSVLPMPVTVVTCTVEEADIPTETDGETSGSTWVRLRDIRDRIADGTLADGHTLAALAMISPLWAVAAP